VKDRSGAVGSPRCQMSGRGAGGDRDVRVGVFGAGVGHGEPFVSRFATPQGLPIGSVLGTSADQNLKNIVWAALATSIHRAHRVGSPREQQFTHALAALWVEA